MTNEELERAMNFIVEMEAKSSSKIDALAQAHRTDQKEAEERWKRADERWARTEEGIRALLAIAEIHEKEIRANSEQIASVSRNVGGLSETTRATDDRLNALINVVERMISERRNGQQ